MGPPPCAYRYAHLPVSLSMNGFDFTPTRHRYRAYPQSLRQLWPLGAPVHGGTALTLFGDGFASYGTHLQGLQPRTSAVL